MSKSELNTKTMHCGTNQRMWFKIEADKIESEYYKKNNPNIPRLGPRTTFLYYVKELKMPIEQAIKKIQEDWNNCYDEETIRGWLNETNHTDKEGRKYYGAR